MTDHSTPADHNTSHPLVSLALTLFFCALFVALGYWQLQRAASQETHAAILLERAHQGALSVVQLARLTNMDDMPLRARGHFDNAHSLLLDNRVLNGRAGYELLTPFITDTGTALLVNRGWLPRGANRNILPTIPPISGEVQVSGLTHKPGHNIFLPLPDKTAPAHWPVLLTELDTTIISQWLGQPLLPVVLRLDPTIHFNAPPLPRHWQAPVRLTPARHRAYAVQWFLFAAIALGIYLTLTWRRRKASPQETDA